MSEESILSTLIRLKNTDEFQKFKASNYITDLISIWRPIEFNKISMYEAIENAERYRKSPPDILNISAYILCILNLKEHLDQNVFYSELKRNFSVLKKNIFMPEVKSSDYSSFLERLANAINSHFLDLKFKFDILNYSGEYSAAKDIITRLLINTNELNFSQSFIHNWKFAL